MADVKDIMAQILLQFPAHSELSNARLTKMIYLSDWRHSIEHGAQISELHWYFDNYGPFVWDIVGTARAHPTLFAVRDKSREQENTLTLISLVTRDYQPDLRPDECESIAHVVGVTKDLAWARFIRLVYSTYPVLSSPKYSALDLPKLAEDYARFREELEAKEHSA